MVVKSFLIILLSCVSIWSEWSRVTGNGGIGTHLRLTITCPVYFKKVSIATLTPSSTTNANPLKGRSPDIAIAGGCVPRMPTPHSVIHLYCDPIAIKTPTWLPYYGPPEYCWWWGTLVQEVQSQQWHCALPSLKLTAKAPENRPFAKRHDRLPTIRFQVRAVTLRELVVVVFEAEALLIFLHTYPPPNGPIYTSPALSSRWFSNCSHWPVLSMVQKSHSLYRISEPSTLRKEAL